MDRIKTDRRLRIITGHYGSGKTEFALNYAVELRRHFTRVALADLDIVNPYFRSREAAGLLQEQGIRLVGSSIPLETMDVPAISAAVNTLWEDEGLHSVIDLGGDPAGARVLGRYRRYWDGIDGDGPDLLLVLNAYRPETDSPGKAVTAMRRIEAETGLTCTGLVNNTHLLKETGKNDVFTGYRLAKEVEARTGVPLRYNAVLAALAGELQGEALTGDIFPITLYMRSGWMS